MQDINFLLKASIIHPTTPAIENEVRKKFLNVIGKNCHKVIQDYLIDNHYDATFLMFTELKWYIEQL